MLANVLKGVLAQQLPPRKGGGRVAAVEIMFGSRPLSSLIREGKTTHITGYIQTGSAQGMRTMDQSLRDLVTSDVIDAHAAMAKALDKDRMRDWLKERGADLPDDVEFA